LPGAGKSTIAKGLHDELLKRGVNSELLDGDEVRKHLSKGLGFSKEDRDTNIRRIGYVATLLARNGIVAITAAISPYRAVRNELRAQIPGFVEVYVKCDMKTLTERDPKGLYKRALAGEIENLTGVTDPYEEPLEPDVVCSTAQESIQESVEKVVQSLERLGHLRLAPWPTHGAAWGGGLP
jgi:adenylyl-sulfate kinase